MTTTADGVDATITIEDAGPCRKKVLIEVPASAIAAEIEGLESQWTTEAALPGFRKGRAPKSLIRKRFGKEIANEAKQRLVSASYRKAIEDNGLRVLGEPGGGDELADTELSPTEPLSFSLEVEVAPEFQTPTTEGFTVYKPTLEVTQEMVDSQVERMCRDEGSLAQRDGAAEPGEYCVGHGVLTIDGADDAADPVHDVEGAVVQIPAADSDGAGMILGLRVEDFAEQFGTPASGDTVSVTTTGPEQHEREDVRGAALTVRYTVETVQRIESASVESLVEKYGMSDESQLRETITLQLNQRTQTEQQSVMRQQVARELVEKADFALPEKRTAQQAERNLERRRLEMMYRGAPEDEIEAALAELRASSDEVARRELKLFFVLDRVASEANVEVSEAEINGRIAAMAAERRQRADKLRAELIKSGSIPGIAQQIREHKAMDDLLAKATVEEISAEDFKAKFDSQSDGDSA